MLLADLYDDSMLDRFIGYCVDQNKMDIKSFKAVLRDYNSGKLTLSETAPAISGEEESSMAYHDDDPELLRDCSYYEANAMTGVRG